MENLKNKIRQSTILYQSFKMLRGFVNGLRGPKRLARSGFKESFGRELNLNAPQTLNEKIQWLKLYDHRPYAKLCCDKFLARDFLVEKFGEEVKQYLVPLLFETQNWNDISMDIIPDYPCIVKPTHTSGDYVIIKDKRNLDIRDLRRKCWFWMHRDYNKEGGEWQYDYKNRRIIIEKLLQKSDGCIPNDYKLHYFNGKLQFVYCSVDRETKNKRNIYDANWSPMYFTWVEKWKDASNLRGDEIDPPASFNLMKKYGDEIAKMFDYVRVDFYDVDGQMYFGEVTLHHGGGYDVFTPEKYDLEFGEKLVLTKFKKR